MGCANQQQSFFQEIMAFNPKKNSESVLNKYRSINNISERGKTSGWVSFKYLSDRDGFEVVMEYNRS